MADSYTVYWARERCNALRRLGGLNKPVTLLFGGPHTSEPSFVRATVHSGDTVFLISVLNGSIYVLGRALVRRILTLDEFIAARPDLFAGLVEKQALLISPRRNSLEAFRAFDRLRAAMPELRPFAPTCTEEAIECESGTPLRLDLAVPPDMLQRIHYRSQRRERDLLKDIRDGRLARTLGVQGIYRLSEASATEFNALVDGVFAPVEL